MTIDGGEWWRGRGDESKGVDWLQRSSDVMLIAASHLWGSNHVSTQAPIIYPPQINNPQEGPRRVMATSSHPPHQHITAVQTPCLHLSPQQGESGDSMQHKKTPNISGVWTSGFPWSCFWCSVMRSDALKSPDLLGGYKHVKPRRIKSPCAHKSSGSEDALLLFLTCTEQSGAEPQRSEQ